MSVMINALQIFFITYSDRWQSQGLYFNNISSRKWNDKQGDISYFVETDAHIFEHVF